MSAAGTGDRRVVGVVTTSRADYGILRPVLAAIGDDPDLDLELYVSGTHLSKAHGQTVQDIAADGFDVAERVPLDFGEDTPEAVARTTARATEGFADVLSRRRPDVLLVTGDRYEMFAAALAALPLKVPVAHLHGGEVTRGAIDDALRHATTKLSHLHLVATEACAHRVRQLGEDPDRVVICGAPALDNLRGFEPLADDEMEARFGVRLDPAPLVATYHPVTLEHERTEQQMHELSAALDKAGRPVVFTMSNADTAHGTVRAAVEAYVRDHPGDAVAVENLGTRAYFTLLGRALAMVGNSSSGILEAASFGLPVVDVGRRQEGRERPVNVVHAEADRQGILAALDRVLDPAFRDGLADLDNPYDQGGAAPIVVRALKDVPLGDEVLLKRFRDLDGRADGTDPDGCPTGTGGAP